ncbi:MAG: copper resistance CopC/CopD family protein, partial [Gaiellales bacterium]
MATSPGRITLRFDQQIRPISGGTDVVNEQNRSVLGGTVHTAPNDVRVLVIPLQPGLPRGDYTVRWGIVSTDGHLISGVFAIGVGSGLPPPQAVSEQSSPLDYPFLSARCLYFAGLLMLVGGTVFRVLVYRPAAATIARENRALADLRERHRANQVLALSAVLALGGGWVALTRQGADVAGVSFWRAFDHRGPVASALEATRFGQVFGRGIDITAAFTLLVAAAYAVAPLRRRLAAALVVPAAAAGVWVLAVPGMSGHAGDPGRSSLTIALDAVHVAAAAVWIGGLLHLFWVTPHATRGLPDGERERVRHEIARRFSRVALVSVAALSASGAARALWEVDAVSKLWTTGYGRTLLVKTALLAVLVALGYRNRRALDRFRSLRRSVATELVLAAMVLGAVALLTNLPPALSPP